MSSTTKTRPAPPPCEHQYPACGICDQETTSDGDCFVCEPCGAYWSYDDASDGGWIDEDDPQCAATGGRRDGKGDPERCLRGENHVDSSDPKARVHHSRTREWGTGVAAWLGVEVTPPAPKADRDQRTAEREAALVRRLRGETVA